MPVGELGRAFYGGEEASLARGRRFTLQNRFPVAGEAFYGAAVVALARGRRFTLQNRFPVAGEAFYGAAGATLARRRCFTAAKEASLARGTRRAWLPRLNKPTLQLIRRSKNSPGLESGMEQPTLEPPASVA